MAISAQQIAHALHAQGVTLEGIQPLPAAHAKCGDGIVAIGRGQPPVEVVVFPALEAVTAAEAREIWRARQAGRPNPLVLLVVSGLEPDSPCKWAGVDPASLVVIDLAWSQSAALAAAALQEPNGAAAVRYLENAVPRPGEDAIVGLNNLGMFARYTLTELAPSYDEWQECAAQGEQIADLRGRELLEALGFTIEAQTGSAVEIMRDGSERAAAVGVFLDQGEDAAEPLSRFGGESPVSAALARAERDNLQFVFITKGDKLRLHTTGRVQGVGRKGPAETLIEVDMPLLDRDKLAYVPLIFSAKAVADGGTFERILAESRDYSVTLSARLRERIYVDVVPSLAVSVADANPDDTLDDVYEQTLVLLFRLLFVAYAEDRDLLPYRRNDRYRAASLKALARELADLVEEGRTHDGDETTSLWARINTLFEAVDKGARNWDVPAYNGGLFAAKATVNQAGAALAAIQLTNAQLGRGLTALLVEPGDGDLSAAPVDFRSLSVRDFGTIYEGLLESGISEAPEDLALDNNGHYVPAGTRQAVVIAGEIYHHNRGGARKSTGSYFTKDFAVEHLLDKALVPAVEAHLERVKALVDDGDPNGAAEAFFDFRCADIAMGSGHFLVAAVDKIEERFSRFLDETPIDGVLAELDRLRAAALRGLRESADLYEIERRALLRRQIARRCIYGVDVNRIAVELAQLALWVHTFVPGLALAYLGHNLVWGNALTGIGTLQEAASALEGDNDSNTISIFLEPIRALLAETTEPLHRLAKANDATREDMQVVYEAQTEATRSADPARALFDLICAQRREEASGVEMALTPEAIGAHHDLPAAEQRSRNLQALHFPVAFPEVFLGPTPGFHCLVGNPPWEKLQVEEHSFWALRFPGLRGERSQAARETAIAEFRIARPDLLSEYQDETAAVQEMKRALVAGPYPGLTAGRPDLFKAFGWRFWQLLREGARMGIVLPRKALEASGTSAWRLELLARGCFEDVTMLVNKRGWVFDDVHPQYTVGLITVSSGEETAPRTVTMRGPFADSAAYESGLHRPAVTVAAEQLSEWSESASFPMLADAESQELFLKIRRHPRLADAAPGWQPRGMREFNATDDRHHFLQDQVSQAWPVYKGESFDTWAPDTGTYYAWADPEHITTVLADRRRNQVRLRRSALWGLPPEVVADSGTMACFMPRIAWRDTARSTDTRTLRCALVPPRVVLVHQAFFLFWRHGDERDVAYTLGVLCSLPFDWFARQVVESRVTIEFMNNAPIPRPDRDDPLRERVGHLAARLAAVDDRYTEWAARNGVEVGSVADGEKPILLAEIDALVSHLYGLDEVDVTRIFETFHPGWDYRQRLELVLEHHKRIARAR